MKKHLFSTIMMGVTSLACTGLGIYETRKIYSKILKDNGIYTDEDPLLKRENIKRYIPCAFLTIFNLYLIKRNYKVNLKDKEVMLAGLGGITESIACRNLSNSKKNKKTVTFVEAFSREAFNATYEDIQRAEYELNRLFILRGYVTVEDFLMYLGLDSVVENSDGIFSKFGWDLDYGCEFGYAWIDFTHRHVTSSSDDYWLIGYPFEPLILPHQGDEYAD